MNAYVYTKLNDDDILLYIYETLMSRWNIENFVRGNMRAHILLSRKEFNFSIRLYYKWVYITT